jgi:hypothetical protein
MSVLYVAVDESGLPSEGRCYVLAGCWYSSERSDSTSPLTGLKDDLLRFVATRQRGQSPGELKGGKMSAETVTGVVDRMADWMWSLETIHTSNLPWKQAHPLGFTRSVFQPSDAHEMFERTAIHRSEMPNVLKELALNVVLTPLHHDRLAIDTHDEVRVILDGDPWVRAGRRTEQRWCERTETTDAPTFETRDSTAVPGIQIADIAASTWLSHLANRNCDRAAAVLHKYRVTR